jgi:hypothetical protein
LAHATRCARFEANSHDRGSAVHGEAIAPSETKPDRSSAISFAKESAMATANVQTVWNCRWSQAGHQITGLSEALQPETAWVCVRDGDRRALCEGECARCSRWEPLEASAAVVMRSVHGAIFTEPVVKTLPLPAPGELAHAMLRTLLVLIAVIFIAIGLTVLTSAASVVFTVAMWLCAAAFVGLAVFAQLPD